MAQKIDPTQLGITPQTTAGKSGQFIRLGDVVICFGFNSVANAGTAINLPYTYSAALWNIQATTQDPNNWPAWVVSYTTSAITLKQAYTTGPLNVNWMTIGPA